MKQKINWESTTYYEKFAIKDPVAFIQSFDMFFVDNENNKNIIYVCSKGIFNSISMYKIYKAKLRSVLKDTKDDEEEQYYYERTDRLPDHTNQVSKSRAILIIKSNCL